MIFYHKLIEAATVSFHEQFLKLVSRSINFLKIVCQQTERLHYLQIAETFVPDLTINKQLRTPYEIHETLTLLYTHLVLHWRKALNTPKTIEYLLKGKKSLTLSK